MSDLHQSTSVTLPVRASVPAGASQWSRLFPSFWPSCRANMASLKCSFRFWISRSVRTFTALSSTFASANRSQANCFSCRAQEKLSKCSRLRPRILFTTKPDIWWTFFHFSRNIYIWSFCIQTLLRNCNSFLRQHISFCKYWTSLSFILRTTWKKVRIIVQKIVNIWWLKTC